MLPPNQEPMTQDESLPAVDLFERTNPRAVLNLVTPAAQSLIVEASLAKPEYFGCDERTLWKKLAFDSKRPNATDNRLRIAFWQEYDRAQAESRDMNMVAVFTGVCTNVYFYTRYMRAPDKVAWMMTPPASYAVVMEEALTFGIEQLRDILEMENMDSKGRPNTKLLELKTKIVAMLDQRVRGAIVQKNMNVNVNTSDKEVAKVAVASTMDSIEKRIKELEARDRRAEREAAKAIDAEVVQEE